MMLNNSWAFMSRHMFVAYTPHYIDNRSAVICHSLFVISKVPLMWRHCLSQKLRHFHMNNSLWVEHECCCRRTFKLLNVNFNTISQVIQYSKCLALIAQMVKAFSTNPKVRVSRNIDRSTSGPRNKSKYIYKDFANLVDMIIVDKNPENQLINKDQ